MIPHHYLLAFFAGALNVLAFSPFKLWWLTIASLVVLIVLANLPQSKSGFKLGFSYGLGFFGFGVSWVFNSLYEFGQAPIAFALFLTIVFVLYLSIFPGIAIWMLRKLLVLQSSVGSRLILFVAVWVLVEWARGWLFTGFPWLSLGAVLVDSPFKGIIPVFGVYGGTAFVVFSAIVIAELARAPARQNGKWLLIAVAIAFLAHASIHIQWTSKAAEQAIKVALVQANIRYEADEGGGGGGVVIWQTTNEAVCVCRCHAL